MTRTQSAAPRAAAGPVTLLVSTRKGAFFLESDKARRRTQRAY